MEHSAGVNNGAMWRRWLLVLCGVSFLALAWDLYAMMGPKSIAGFLGARPDPAFHERVVVFPGSPAFKSGLRTGDSVAVLRLPAPDRYRFPGPYWGTDPIDLPIDRHARIEIVRVRPLLARYGHQSVQVWLGYAGAALALAAAALLILRRADNVEARILSLFLILGVGSPALASNNWITPWPLLDAWVSCIGFICEVAWALQAMYALRLARPAGRVRRAVTGLTYLGTVAVVVYQIAFAAGTWYGVLDPFGPALSGPFFQLTQAFIFIALPLICLGLGIARSRGEERTRISWGAGPIAIYYLGNVAGTVASLFDPTGFLTGDISNVALFIMPLGLLYALLSSRLLDIGFALNRAAVFAATTLLLAGLFAGLQSLANLTLSNLDRSHNILLRHSARTA